MNTAAGPRPRFVAGLRLVQLVGSGGEGEVWEARDQRGRPRAMKLIRPDALADDAEQRVEHLLVIDHPALVRVYDGGLLDEGLLAGWGYLEMEYIDGPSLQDADPDAAVLQRLEPLAEALDLLHTGAWTGGLPLVHRDVKPANLVESPDARLVLVDPSTLRGIDATQLTRIGTPVFSAPEVMTGRFGPPADVYSFAATVVALLTGERGERLAALLDEAHQLDLPEGVASALSPVPGDRPTSCRAVLEAGTELAEDTTVFLPVLDHTREFDQWEAAPWTKRRQHEDPARQRYQSYAGGGPALEPQREDAPLATARRRHLGLWTALFLLLVAVPAAAWALGFIPNRSLLPVVVAVAAVHLGLHVAARRSVAAAVLVPPIAWALLLGDEVEGGRRRRAWGGAVFTAALAPAVVGAVTAALEQTPQAVQTAALLTAGTCLAVVITAAAANRRGAGAVLVRLLLSPLWVAGAAVLIIGGLLLAPFGIARGLARRTAASLLNGLRSPARMPTPSTPDWRDAT